MSTIEHSHYPRIPQRGIFSCIPAAIENVLVYFGETSWTQEKIVEAWPSEGGKDPRFDLASPTKFLPKTDLGVRFRFEFERCESTKFAIDLIAQRLAACRS